MQYTFIEHTDPKEFDTFVLHSSQNNLFQSSSWATLKENWESHFLSVKEGDKIVGAALVLIRPLILGKKLAYIPRGPIMDFHNEELIRFFFEHLKQFAKNQHCAIVRFDPEIIYHKFTYQERNDAHENQNEDILSLFQSLGIRHKGFTTHIPEATQPRFNAMMEVTEDYRNHLVKNTNQSIRTAIKRGAEVYVGKEYLHDFAMVMKETEKRNHIALRNEEYFQKMLDAFGEHATVMVTKLNFPRQIQLVNQEIENLENDLLHVEHEKQKKSILKQIDDLTKELSFLQEHYEEEGKDEVTICGKLVCWNDSRMEFFYMGNHPKYMRIRANYLLYSKFLDYCVENHIPYCSFGGIDGSLKDGLTQFKSAWPISIEEYVGEFNIVFDPVIFWLFEKAYPQYLTLMGKLRSQDS